MKTNWQSPTSRAIRLHQIAGIHQIHGLMKRHFGSAAGGGLSAHGVGPGGVDRGAI
jgi:hypothetical protein